MKAFTFGVWLLLAAGALLAQGPGGGPMGGGFDSQTLLVNTPKGLFALRSGVLAKYDITTLKAQQVFELFGPMPAPPAQGADRTAWGTYFAEMARRNAPAVMFARDNSLIVIVGDGFAKISQDTLKVELSADLRPADAAAAEPGRGFREPTPGYLVVGNTLYLMRGKEMLSVALTDGKVQRTPLPKELQPQQANFRGDGGNREGGNRGGGNRGGGGGGRGQ